MLPSTIAIGVSFILNATTYPLAMGMGATVAWLWQKFDADSHAMYMYAVAAGFIAGEGMGGIVTAILQIAGVSGAFYGTAAVSGALSFVLPCTFHSHVDHVADIHRDVRLVCTVVDTKSSQEQE